MYFSDKRPVLVTTVCWIFCSTFAHAATPTDSECFLDWAETQVPDLLTPAHQPTQTAGTISYRAYPISGIYVGTDGTSALALGGIMGSSIKNLGAFNSFLPIARAANCGTPTIALPPVSQWKLSASGFYTYLMQDSGRILKWSNTSPIALDTTFSTLSEIVDMKSGNVLRSDGSAWTQDFVCDTTTCTGKLYQLPIPGYVSSLAVASNRSSYATGVLSDGKVWAWGNFELPDPSNGNGNSSQRTQLGIKPIQISELNAIKSVAIGYGHALALRSDGDVFAWGSLIRSLGTTVNGMDTAQPVMGLHNVTAVAAGGYQSVALTADGHVWMWGYNGIAQPTPPRISQDSYTWDIPTDLGLSDITAITAGETHAAALKKDGTVWTWGQNDYAQLGNGTIIASAIPVQVVGLSDVISIAAGFGYTVALQRDGTIWTWGATDARNIESPIDKCVFTWSILGLPMQEDRACSKLPVKVRIPQN